VAARDLAVRQVPLQARLLRGRLSVRRQLEQLEAAGLPARSPELLAAVAWLVLLDVRIDLDELKAARRRAVLTLAAGGDPHRDLDLDSAAVDRLAAELDAPDRRAAVDEALAALETDGLPAVDETVQLLRSDAELAWRTFALAHLADEVTED
jgi:hypothetical protein